MGLLVGLAILIAGFHGPTLSTGQVHSIALDVSGFDREYAEFIAIHTYCESHRRTRSVGIYGELGLAQIHPVHFDLVDEERLFEPRYNLLVAWRIYTMQGKTAWSCYKG